MDAETGATLWRYRYDWPFEMTGLYPGPFSTPTLYQDHVYFTTPAGACGCLSQTGKLVWLREVKKEFNGQGTDFGYACSPTIVDDKVILPVGGVGASIVALDAATGDIAWKSGDEPASYTPIVPITIQGEQQIIGYLQHDMVGCDLKTGKLLWKQTLSRGYDEHSAWPLYREPLLWTSAPFQAGSHLWEITVDNGTSCQEVWHSEWMSNDVSSSVLVGDTIYGFDLAEAQSKAHRPSRGSFRAMDFASGTLRWSNGDAEARRPTDFQTNQAAQIVGHASVLAADGKLFLLNDLGDLILAEANPDQYIELGRTRVLGGEIGWASPALDNGRLYVRNQSRAVCLYVGNNSEIIHAQTLRVSDVPQGTVRDYSRWLGVEPAYAMDAPTQKWLWTWYLAGVGILTIAGVAAFLPRLVSPHRISASHCRMLFILIAWVLGIFIGPLASLLNNDFIFTWPVTLFVAFAAAIYQSEMRRNLPNATASQKRFGRWVALLFLVTCAAYFVACRRLSLVTQWTFLCGFPGAIPALLLDRYSKISAENKSAAESNISLVRSWGLMQLAFAMYFSMTIAALSTKYELVDQ